MPTTVSSVCPLDCPDRCSLDVSVEPGRRGDAEGRVAAFDKAMAARQQKIFGG